MSTHCDDGDCDAALALSPDREVERLRAENDRLRGDRSILFAEQERLQAALAVAIKNTEKALDLSLAYVAERDAALARVAQVEAALRPFAAFEVPTDYRQKGYRGPVYTYNWHELTVDDFDAARAALSSPPPHDGEGGP